MALYKAFYNGKSKEIEAETMYDAKKKAITEFKPPKNKEHMVSVVLMRRQDGTEVVHKPEEL